MFFVLFLILGVSHLSFAQNATDSASGKVLSVFNVVRFPNDQCDGGSSKNGTCYTTSECTSRGGSSSGTCANGYGVCCIFTLGCGGQSSENSTYFENPAGVGAGQCTATICKVNSDICKLRIDFNTFAISGPSTVTLSDSNIFAGQTVAAGKGKDSETRTRCLTDYFSVTGPSGSNPSVICGTNTGTHMYVDARSDCNKLTFHLGPAAVGLAKVDTRSWSLKVSQISCFDTNIPPPGCTQYFYGATTGTIQSYNYGATTPYHLANQRQKICIRREKGLCRMCYYAATKTDFQISGLKATTGGFAKTASLCCGYGTDGKKNSKGFDCLLLPGAQNGKSTFLKSSRACGNVFITGVTKSTKLSATTGTVCTHSTPFMVEFITDNYEYNTEAGSKGFKLAYFEDATGCTAP